LGFEFATVAQNEATIGWIAALAGAADTSISAPTRTEVTPTFYRAGLFALAHWALHSAWTICARVARKMRLLMLAPCAITISACARLPATVPAGVDNRKRKT
jgi:hypothetical protein